MIWWMVVLKWFILDRRDVDVNSDARKPETDFPRRSLGHRAVKAVTKREQILLPDLPRTSLFKARFETTVAFRSSGELRLCFDERDDRPFGRKKAIVRMAEATKRRRSRTRSIPPVHSTQTGSPHPLRRYALCVGISMRPDRRYRFTSTHERLRAHADHPDLDFRRRSIKASKRTTVFDRDVSMADGETEWSRRIRPPLLLFKNADVHLPWTAHPIFPDTRIR